MLQLDIVNSLCVYQSSWSEKLHQPWFADYVPASLTLAVPTKFSRSFFQYNILLLLTDFDWAKFVRMSLKVNFLDLDTTGVSFRLKSSAP